MEKALIDILIEEQSAVKDVNKIQRDIECAREYRDHAICYLPDCEAKTKELARIKDELVQLAGRKLKYEANLETIRRELAGYINYLMN